MNVSRLLKKERDYADVLCEDKELEKFIGVWLGVKKNVLREFGKVLVKLGFDVNDKFVLCKYRKEIGSFTYIVNGRNPYKKNTIWLWDDTVIVTTGTKKTKIRNVYKDIDNRKKYNIANYTKEDKKGDMYRRIYQKIDAKICVYKGDYILELNVYNPNEVNDKSDNYKLKNEIALVEYLNKLEFPISIDEIYKNICNISLKDINNYPKVSIRLVKNNNLEDMVIEELILYNGKLGSLYVVKGNKHIHVDGRGNYYYEIEKDGKVKSLDNDDYSLMMEEDKKVKRLVKFIDNKK